MNPIPQEIDEFEKEEMIKIRSVVKKKSNLNKWCDWVVDHVPKPVKNAASKAFFKGKK